MPLPDDVPTFQIEFDVVDFSGEEAAEGILVSIVPVDPVSGRPIRLTHVASGQVLLPVPAVFELTSTVTLSPQLAHTDTEALSPRNFAYAVRFPGRRSLGGRRVSVPLEAGPLVSWGKLRLSDTSRELVSVPVNVGPKGETGPQGEQGPQGIQGEVGPVGPRGPTGPVGPQGQQGDRGDTGLTGATGSTGPTGPRGLQGNTGPVGPVGPAGLTWRGTWDPAVVYEPDDAVYYGGSSWFAVAGSTGVRPDLDPGTDWQPLAARGATGPTGPAGAQGPVGPQGDVGPRGPDGPAGPQGPIGPTGLVGPQGATGPAGPQGDVGAQGPAGATGAKGDPGDLTPATQSAGLNGALALTSGMVPSTRQWALAGNITVSISSNPASTLSGTITLVIKQAASGTGPFTVTWPAGIAWAGGAPAPVMPTAASARLVVHLFWTGVEWLGAVMGTFF
jgi:hypothetical protein